MTAGPLLRIVAGLFAAPVAWMGQMLLSQPLVSGLCALARPGLLSVLLNGVGLLCLLVAALGGWAALSLWREERQPQHRPAGAIDRGTRPRAFLALLGMMSSGLFFCAIVFSSLAPLLVTPCVKGA
ncbi:MAG: hypothetical protein ACJ8HI_08810 [Massilia sp.]